MKSTFVILAYITCVLSFAGCAKTDPIEIASQNDIEAVKAYVDEGFDINIINSNGTTMLLAATIEGHSDLVEYLLKSGADPNLSNVQGTSPLFGASLLGFNEIVANLLANGANPNIRLDGIYVTPLMIAIANNRTDVVATLLQHGVYLTIENSEGKTAAELVENEEIRELFNKLASGN
ncbi:ankyrin repeat domain-containing protein [Rheinheimera sp.]|uniref:ankyrin repeat domain-containing protein n=1 Tax=Rheinheimera sp. TaxID=1869214 RepID=UPI002354602C|nr:ankyrin repeat domain-containing protein [Rheinheimera sp.]